MLVFYLIENVFCIIKKDINKNLFSNRNIKVNINILVLPVVT